MTHFAIIAPPLPGHLNPLVALGETLIDRGHRVSFLHLPETAYLVEGSRVRFVPTGSGSGAVAGDAVIHAMGRRRGLLGARKTIRTVAGWSDMLCEEAPALLERIGANAIISDQMEGAGGLIAEGLGMPYATVATALPIDREPDVPPAYLGWHYDRSAFGRWRNRGGYRVADWLMRPVSRVLERHAVRQGIRPRGRADQYGSPAASLYQAVPSIDFPRRRVSKAQWHVGPLRRPEPGKIDLGDQRKPRIFCSFGSLQGDRIDLFRRIAAACSAVGAQLTLAHGGRLSESDIASLSATADVHVFVPQRSLLGQVDVAITHAGFNTVLDALSHGVPMLALPMAFEQHATAARIRHAGVGIVRPPGASTRRIAADLRQLLTETAFRERAVGVAQEIAVAGGVERAADIVEGLCG